MAFRRTDPQRSLFESEFLLPAKKRRLLEKSWAIPFRDVVLPLINEDLLRNAFKEGGRPNVPIRMLVGLHLLKEWNDFTDAQVIENLQFNLQWHCALGLTADSADVCQKTLHNFRQRMLELDVSKQMFDDIAAGLVKKSKLSVSMQRLDSTHVISNIAVLTRLGLFTETVLTLLRALRREQPAHLDALPARYRERYLDREGYFADARKEEVPRRLGQVARDMHRLIERFSEVEAVSTLEAFEILQRVFSEQCEVVESPETGSAEADAPTEVSAQPKEPKTVSANSVQSPHDADATYGHKGKGYEVQVAETCGSDDPYRVVTHVSVNGANESDKHTTLPIIDALDGAGMKPHTLLADTSYSGGENLVEAAERDVELVAPVQDPNKGERDDEDTNHPVGLAGFSFDTTCHEVLACTAGHPPREQRMRGPNLVALFAAAHCADCPFADSCPTRKLTSGDRKLSRRPKTIATKLRQFEQRQRHFKERYKLRSGIESVNRELKQRHGFAKPRVRGRPRLELAVRLKVMALNAKRAAEFYARQVVEAREHALVGV
jgi:hypothetical protein